MSAPTRIASPMVDPKLTILAPGSENRSTVPKPISAVVAASTVTNEAAVETTLTPSPPDVNVVPAVPDEITVPA